MVLSSCALGPTGSLVLEFDTALLAGETVVLHEYNKSMNNAVAAAPGMPVTNHDMWQQCYDTVKSVCADHLHSYSDCRNCKSGPGGDAAWAKLMPACHNNHSRGPINNFHDTCQMFFPARIPLRGSLLEVLVGQGDADGSAAFCLEPMLNGTTEYCPAWAGGPADFSSSAGKWLGVDIISAGASSVKIDLSALKGKAPAAVRYAWGVFDCCNAGDPLLYKSKSCDSACPITASGSALLPANPFMAKLVGGKCSCVAPQVC